MLKYVREQVSIYDLDGELTYARDKIAEWIKLYGEKATIDFEIGRTQYDYDDSIIVILCYSREESNEEKKLRIAKEKQHKAIRKQQDEENYERLKMKLGK